MQLIVGENRKTPNFNNSLSRDFGESELIHMMTAKDQTIKQLKNQIEQFKNSNLSSYRNSGESFGVYTISFGEIN